MDVDMDSAQSEHVECTNNDTDDMDLDSCSLPAASSKRSGHTRTYYGGAIPAYIQAEKHVFVEAELCKLFRNMTVFAHVAAASAARIYNRSVGHAERMPLRWPTARLLRGEVVSDIFDLYSLLLHHMEHGTILSVPHEAEDQIRRLSGAMEERNKFMALCGQEQYAHACDLCLRVKETNGVFSYYDALVMDGVCIGHASCRVHSCQKALVPRSLFCAEHSSEAAVCHVVDCEQLCEQGHRTCALPAHRELERHWAEKGQAMFQLKSRLREAGLTVPGEEDLDESAVAAEGDASDIEDDTPAEECEGKSEEGNRKLRTKFGRNYTHNEQTMVRPCGVIIARATFFGAEGIADAVNFAKAACPTRRSIPCYLFHDNNCGFWKHLLANDDHYFDECGLPVDVFHFNCKHKATDTFCALHCNPASFPELYDENGNWAFNSSACEQSNVWFKGFKALVREMLPVRYAFFLDECIKERNRFTVEQLAKAGLSPFIKPLETWFY